MKAKRWSSNTPDKQEVRLPKNRCQMEAWQSTLESYALLLRKPSRVFPVPLNASVMLSISFQHFSITQNTLFPRNPHVPFPGPATAYFNGFDLKNKLLTVTYSSH